MQRITCVAWQTRSDCWCLAGNRAVNTLAWRTAGMDPVHQSSGSAGSGCWYSEWIKRRYRYAAGWCCPCDRNTNICGSEMRIAHRVGCWLYRWSLSLRFKKWYSRILWYRRHSRHELWPRISVTFSEIPHCTQRWLRKGIAGWRWPGNAGSYSSGWWGRITYRCRIS